MTRLIYYVAMSLDGFIADDQGGVGWLPIPDTTPTGEDFGYTEFYNAISAIIMGSKTYQQALTLTESWPYSNVETVVMTQQTLVHPKEGSVSFSSDAPATVLADLRERHQGAIWLMGGAALAASFAEADLIDEYNIAIIPTVLGAGIPLLAHRPTSNVHHLQLIEHRVFNEGIVQLRYHRARLKHL